MVILLYTCATRSSVNYIEPTSNGISVGLYNDSLKMGGPEDDDSNDSLLESNLEKHFEKILKKRYPDWKIVSWVGSEKGYWGCTIQNTKENAKYKKIKAEKDKLQKVQKYLEDFNQSVATRI